MGCDIHLSVEVNLRGKNDGPPTWRAVRDTLAVAGFWGEYHTPNNWYQGRNYTEFAALAGVRNYEEVQPLDEPRGIPDDVSEEIARDHAAWGGDAHSASHFTLAELRGPDGFWSQAITEPNRARAELKDLCGYLHHRLIPRLEDLKWNLQFAFGVNQDRITDDDIRIIFWFDN